MFILYNNYYTNGVVMLKPHKILARLGLSDVEAQVYLTMTAGSLSVAEIIKTTGLKRPTVYYVLNRLVQLGLVTKTDGSATTAFHIEPPQRLEVLAQKMLSEAQETKLSVVDLIPSLEEKMHGVAEKPQVSFFEGKQAVQNVIMESLYCHSREHHSIAPQNNYFWQVGRSFVEKFVVQRYERKVKISNLWEQPIAPDIYKQYYDGVAKVRLLPKVMHGKFDTTIFLYDDKALYISSMKSNYCLLVRSQEHYNTMRALFDGLWSVSKPHPE